MRKSMSVVQPVFVEAMNQKRFSKSLPPTKRNIAFVKNKPDQIEFYNTAMADRLLISGVRHFVGDVPRRDLVKWRALYPRPFWLKHFDWYNEEMAYHGKNVLRFEWVKKPRYYTKQTPAHKQDLPIKFS